MNDDDIVNIPLRYGDACSLNLILSKADILIGYGLKDQYKLWHPVIDRVQDTLFETLLPLVETKELPDKVLVEILNYDPGSL